MRTPPPASPLFENTRFVAPDRIGPLQVLPDGRRFIALTERHVVIFDGESGRVVGQVEIGRRPFYRGGLGVAPDGKQAIVFSELDAQSVSLVDINTDTSLISRKLEIAEPPAPQGVKEEDRGTSYVAAALSKNQIVIARSRSVTLLDRKTGAVIREDVCNPHFTSRTSDTRVTIGATGKIILWQAEEEGLICRTLDEQGNQTGTDVTLSTEALGGTLADDPILSDDETLLVVPVQTPSYELQLALFDPRTGSEIITGAASSDGGAKPTRLTQRGVRSNVELYISPKNDLIVALLHKTLQCWSVAKGEMLWSSPNWGPLGSVAFHPNGNRLIVARGERVVFIDLATGKRLGDHEGPSQTIMSVVRDRRGRTIAKDALRAYVIENGRVREETDAWSCHAVENEEESDDDGGGDDAFIYASDGTLLRVEDSGLTPVAEPKIDNDHKGGATTIQLRGQWLLYPDPNGRELLHLANRRELANPRTMRVVKLGAKPVHEAHFAGDEAIAVVHVSHDEANDYRMVQSVAFWIDTSMKAARLEAPQTSRDLPMNVLWERPIEGEDMAKLLAASETAVVFAKGNDVVILAASNGAPLAEIKLKDEAAGCAIAHDDVFVVARNGDVHRLSTKTRTAEKVANIGAGATAFHIDSCGRGIAAFGCQAIREIDLGLPSRSSSSSSATKPMVKKTSKKQRLLHRFNHETEIIAFGLSPDGSLLATGSWVGDDYERGGTLQIWDARTGRVVHVHDPIAGGVGWPDYRNTIQWSPSGKEIALAFNTNGVGVFDPFGDAPLPRMTAYTTDGWSRPPAYTWSRKGDQIAISSWSQRSYIPSCIVETSQRHFDDTTARWFAKKDPNANEHVRSASTSDTTTEEEEERPFKDAARGLHFDADGATLFAHNGAHGQAWAVDTATGALRYKVDTTDELFAWSPCGQYLASTGEAGVVTFRAAATGEVIAEVAEAASEDDDADEEISGGSGACILMWSPNRKTPRLAVAGGRGVRFFEGSKLLSEIPIVIEPERDFDADPFAWSPDGSCAAWIRRLDDESDDVGETKKRLEVYSIGPIGDGDALKHLFTVDVSSGACGLLWNADDRIVCIGKSVFEAVQLDKERSSGRRIYSRDLSIPTELLPDTPSPLTIDDEDLGATFALNPAFPLKTLNGSEPAWGLAFESGQIVCPSELRDQLSDALSPFDSANVELFEDLATALPHLPLSAEAKAKIAASLSPTEEPVADVLPLRGASNNTTSAALGQLSDLLWESVKSLGSGWRSHASEAVHEAAVIHARRGEADLAACHARNVPQEHDRVMALADCAAWLAACSNGDSSSQTMSVARQLLKEAEAIYEDMDMEMEDWFRPFVEADLGAAQLMLGDKAKGEASLNRAEKLTGELDESNIFQNCTHLAAAYLRANDVERARKAMDQGPWDAGYLHTFLPKYITHAAESGFLDHAIEMANKCREHFDEVDSNNAAVIARGLLRAKRHDDLFALIKEEGSFLSPYEDEAIEDLLVSGEVDRAIQHLSEAKGAQDPIGLARKMKILARYAPMMVPVLLDKVLLAMPNQESRDGIAEMAESLGQALTTIGQGDATTALENGLDEEEIFGLQCGRARSGDPIAVKRGLEYARSRSGPREKMAALAMLGRSLVSGAVFDEARAFAKELRGNDRRFALSELMGSELQAGNLAGAYQTWRAQSKANREYEVSNLVDALGAARETDALLHVLRQLHKRDDMNGLPQQIMRAIKHASGFSTAIV